MSQWTQVSGSIRIDGLVGLGGTTDESIKRAITTALGPTATFDGPRDIWERKDKTPTGSEGGIRHEYIVTADDPHSASRGVVVLTGSLRDYGEDEYAEIVEWLNRVFAGEPSKEKPYFVRQGSVELIIEGTKTVLLVWSGKNSRFEEHVI